MKSNDSSGRTAALRLGAAAAIAAFLAGCGSGGNAIPPFAASPAISQATSPLAKRGATIREFSIPPGSGAPSIVLGPSNAMWFTQPGTYPTYKVNSIGRMTPDGATKTFPVRLSQCGLIGLAVGPDGAIWLAEYQSGKIGRMLPDGVLANEFALPKLNPVFIINGPDGALWFTDEQKAGKIGRITVHGAVTAYPVSGTPVDLTVGSDGAIWFTDSNNTIGRMTTGGAVKEYRIPTKSSVPLGIATGPDGNVWFAESGSNKIGRITPAGSIVEFAVPTHNSGPNQLAAGPGNAMWFTENTAGKIGRITTGGTVTEYDIPTKKSAPLGITAGIDHTIWFTEYAGDKIGRLKLNP